MLRVLSFTTALLASVGAGVGISSQAQATTLTVQDAYSAVQLALRGHGEAQVNLADYGTTFASLSEFLGGASGTGIAGSQPAPYLHGSVLVENSDSQSILNSQMWYFFGLDGPAGIDVPVTITASSWVSAAASEADMNGTQLYISGLGITDPLLGITCVAGTANNCGETGISDSFSFSTTLILQSMQEYSLQLSLYLSATGWWPGSGIATGYIDPIITIHPDYANQFSLVLSDGVGNSVSPVPVPGALLLFATGLGGLGLVGWRRGRRMSRVVAA